MYLITVPHSGTFFTRSVLDAMGVEYRFSHVKSLDNDGFWSKVEQSQAVIPLRDPVLTQISTYNRGEHYWTPDLWRYVARWRDREDKHFFRVDCPPEERDGELVRLASFVGAAPPDVEWEPVNAHEDVTGLKGEYGSGPVPRYLRPVVTTLYASEGVMELFRDNGYDLGWMH